MNRAKLTGLLIHKKVEVEIKTSYRVERFVCSPFTFNCLCRDYPFFYTPSTGEHSLIGYTVHPDNYIPDNEIWGMDGNGEMLFKVVIDEDRQ